MRILVGITGGIAAYKSASLVRLLTEAGHEIKVLPTANALKFIGSATLEALSHNSVDPDLYSQVEDVKHIKLAQEAELVIVAPATTAFLARYSHGLADDLLLNVLLATTAPVYVAPAMHTEMWNNPATKANVETLIGRGVNIIEPGVGRLTGSDTGVGRMAEPEDIFKQVFASRDGSLTGKHVVIAAGGTQEPIDAVRFIGNRSSGKQGVALTKSALMRGAQVTLIDCNMSVTAPNGAEVIKAPTAHELQKTLEQLLGTADVIMMPVAVSDFGISNPYPGKLSRVENQTVAIELTPNPDILTGLTAAARTSNLKVIFVGFAAEAVSSPIELLDNAKKKYSKKGVQLQVANNITGAAIFGSDSTEVVLLDGESDKTLAGTKEQVAEEILAKVEKLLER